MRTRTLIIGAGQAGLALSHHLTQAGHEHVLLERGRIAERWRSERPDNFRLLTPNWINRLPGADHPGTDPDGFMDRQEVVDWFTAHAAAIAAPVRTGVTVRAVRPSGDGGWDVATDGGVHRADHVVVATGHMDRPSVPRIADQLPPGITQVHSSRYRNPGRLPDGTVLVVGAGPSGQQVAEELAAAGRRVVLAAGSHRALPRRYRSRDVYWWMHRLGLLARTVDTLPDPTAAARVTRSAVLRGGHEDLDLRHLVARGVRPVGRLTGVEGSRLVLGTNLADDLARADANAFGLRRRIDEYVATTGLDVPEEPWTVPSTPAWAGRSPGSLDLVAEGVTAIVWATGYHRDWSWIEADVLDRHGEPIHRRGVTAEPGLSFLGLRWLYRRDSGFIGGVGADAAHLAEHLVVGRTRVAA